MSKKVYVHFETGGGEHGCTVTQNVSENDTVNLILERFVATYNQKFTKSLATNNFELFDADGKNLLGSKRKNVYDDLENADDLFVKLSTAVTTTKPVVTITKDDTSSVKASTDSKASSEITVKKTAVVKPLSKKSREEINDFIAKKAYKRARKLCEQLLSNHPNDSLLYMRLSEIYLQTNRYKEAMTYCNKALVQHKNSLNLNFLLAKLLRLTDSPDEALDVVESILATKLASRLLAPVDDTEKVRKTITDWTLDVIALQSECLFELGRHNEAANVINSSMKYPESEKHLSVLTVYANIAMQYNKLEEPVRALLKSITVDKNSKRTKDLMARLLSSDQGVDELIRQVPTADASASAFAFVATMLKDVSVMKSCIRIYELCMSLQPKSASFALNLVHVYEILGDYDGAFKALQGFIKKNPNLQLFGYTINHLKLIVEWALHRSLDNSSASSTSSSGNTSPKGTGTRGNPTEASCNIDGEIMYQLTWINDEEANAAKLHRSPINENFQQTTFSPSGFVAVAANRVGEVVDSDATSVVLSIIDHANSHIDANNPFKANHKRTYTHDELDFLAIGYTVFKLIYLQGKMTLLPPLIAMLESARLASSKPLHETFVRNENAYYAAISQLLAETTAADPASTSVHGTDSKADATRVASNTHPTDSTTSSVTTDTGVSNLVFNLIHQENILATKKNSNSTNNITSAINVRSYNFYYEAKQQPYYICGDSHILSSAWKVLTVKNVKRLIIPKLATGVKQWHLRKESKFYPKTHFYNMVKSIPTGADVILVIGEIDCREGMLLAVERDYYENIEQAMQCTVNQFMTTLTHLVNTKKFNIYIHPIIPVLNETRPLVIEYNKCYQAAVKKLNLPGLHWLDLFDDLLVPNTGLKLDINSGGSTDSGSFKPSWNSHMLNDRYKLDGTHLHPNYAVLIEQALNKL